VIHLSPWQTAPWPDQVDCIITDPPYSERTHAGQPDNRREINYASLSPADCHEWAAAWAPRVRYWIAVMCDTDLVVPWRDAMAAAGLFSKFAPVPCIIPGMTVRMAGDGPSSWSVSLVVARTKQAAKWGALPGAYWSSPETARAGARIGGKPLPLMQQIIRDYSRPEMLVADPCAGHGTTLVAAKGAGRLVWGAECDPAAHRAACERLDAVQVPTLIPPDRSRQSNLL
jgi:site-specific DNA-methyltransferase (adenine-specific)